ncbi:transcription factor IIA subunit alpha [Extremus antarcticus]|uniref:Transcription factor IIA subunit alpha n=1 Tax=Extremus antarcticus TaxID=702011 RepID=A0AAJ0G9T4_9PEZI|nr:transcription factor IIA subunit alpha [Extremus antarcticus]
MTNQLVGDVYAEIIKEVIKQSAEDFETTGVGQGTLQELQASGHAPFLSTSLPAQLKIRLERLSQRKRGCENEWQTKLTEHGVAQMPWDPKPETRAPAPAAAHPTNATNLPPSQYASYNTPPSTAANGNRVKAEPGTDHQYTGLPNGYVHNGPQPQGGSARAQQLIQQQYGASANASLNAMQRAGGGLALPGQPQQQHGQPRPQGLQLPGQPQQTQQQYAMQQQQQAAMQRQQPQLHQQQQQPRIKMENSSPQLPQGPFQQQQQQPNYSQTDGADDALGQWQALLAERRAVSPEQRQQADRMMRDQVMQSSADLESGLMLPLNELSSSKRQKRGKTAASSSKPRQPRSDIPQLDGVADDEDEEKPDVKEEDDADAINSDLDDPDDDGPNGMGDEDDEHGDTILCTYDKVQRVKNKWKCTLKDGIMSVGKKEWVFHKGTGEFEW